MASILVLSAARAVQGWLFFSLDEHVSHSTDAGGVFRHPATSAEWKTFESSSADVPVNASRVSGKEAMVQGMSVQHDCSMNVIKEGGRVMRR